MKHCIEGFVSGRVQGVSYRQFTQQHAQALGITGWVQNLDDGRVAFAACGDAMAIKQLLALLHQGPPHACVNALEYHQTDTHDWPAFTVLR